jgi:hypothetical protein
MEAARTATWRSGYAEVCKTFYPGSIPGVASSKFNDLAEPDERLQDRVSCRPHPVGHAGTAQTNSRGGPASKRSSPSPSSPTMDGLLTALCRGSLEAVDAVAGLPSRYATKVPNGARRLGPMSPAAVIGALGLKRAILEDREALARIGHRRTHATDRLKAPRGGPTAEMPGQGRPGSSLPRRRGSKRGGGAKSGSRYYSVGALFKQRRSRG